MFYIMYITYITFKNTIFKIYLNLKNKILKN